MYNDSSNPNVRNTIIYGNEPSGTGVANAGSSVPVFYYSMVEGSFDDNGLWIAAVGTDGGYNKDGPPYFVKSGFDANGNMQQGDYRLAKKGDAVDGGRNVYLWEIIAPMNYSLLRPAQGDFVDISYDLARKERIIGLYVDMGAYEFEGKDIVDGVIMRKVYIPETEGLETDPPAGLHYAISHQDFVFTVMPKPGYNLEHLIVKTGIPERDKYAVVLKMNDDGSVTVTLRMVYETLELSFSGITRTANEALPKSRVWANSGNICIETPVAGTVYIYTQAGQLYKQQTVTEGTTTIAAGHGFYVVRMGEGVWKIINN